jgi:hypothetical protein
VRRPCCIVEEWGPFTACAFKDNAYKQSRVRKVSGDASCAITYKSYEEKQCCIVGKWTAWSACKKGRQSKSRELRGDADQCRPIKKSRTRACCSAGKWGKWSACSRKGQHSRTRKIYGPRSCGHRAEFARNETQACCYVGKWRKWSKCQPTRNIKLRTRRVIGNTTCQARNPAQQEKNCQSGKVVNVPVVNTATPVVSQALPATQSVVPSTISSVQLSGPQIVSGNSQPAAAANVAFDTAHANYRVQPIYLVTPEQPRFAEARAEAQAQTEATSIDFAARIRAAAREESDA